MGNYTDLQDRLQALACAVTDNFCYSCYKIVEGDRCPDCDTDDFMRHLEGFGVEYGTDWVIKALIQQRCLSISVSDQEDLYNDMLNACHPKIKFGELTFFPSRIIKKLDPTAYKIGLDEYFDDPDQWYEMDGELYYVFDVVAMIDELA